MKLISLNIWGGKKLKPLLAFIKKQSEDTDIFCFQEVFKPLSPSKQNLNRSINILCDLENTLSDFQSYFVPTLQGRDQYGIISEDGEFGLACFVKKDIKIILSKDIFVHGKRGDGITIKNGHKDYPRNLMYLKLRVKGRTLNIFNLHGLWTPDKLDNEDRINQSNKVRKIMEAQSGEKILCGDFNLDINTRSLQILEIKMRNLIKEYKIPTTRSRLYTLYSKFADYTLVSKGIAVDNFSVPDVVVSDHLPMILEFT